MFRLKNLFSLSITVGHQFFFSTPMLDFFYLGVVSGADFSFVLYKLKEILFSLLILRSFLISILNRKKFIFFLIFSKWNQYLVVSALFDSFFSKKKVLKNKFLFYFMLTPRIGFLSSMTQRAISFQEDVDLPKNISFNNVIAVSFGDAVLPIVVHEVASKRGIVIGLVDSNQVKVWSHVDYIISGNDDSLAVAYFFGLFILHILFFK